MLSNLKIDLARLSGRLQALGRIGALPGGGVCRLALSAEDKGGRDQLVAWMRDLGLTVRIDPLGTIVGVRPGLVDCAPVMTGSHIDTVRTGGLYDGALGVLAGLEVVATLNDAGIKTERPLAVAAFTNEEGARFAPDMMGSLVYVGGMPVEEALATEGIDGATVGGALQAIGYAGTDPAIRPAAFIELHIEQGPVLDREGLRVGAVTGVQGISWTEYTLTGISNHAGTTPMAMRRDAGYAAAAVAVAVRRVVTEMGPPQVGTVGALTLSPNLVNVVANQAVLTVDLRNTDEALLQKAETRVRQAVAEIASAEGVSMASRRLARFEPVPFDPDLVARVERLARSAGLSARRMPSGAGHDAQMMARVCPAAMIFVPSKDGISHNIEEYTAPEDVEAGANLLLHLLVDLASSP